MIHFVQNITNIKLHIYREIVTFPYKVLDEEQYLPPWRQYVQQRETATERLADVIQVIQLGRRTGMLSVERGQGPTFEEGTLTFANGQITQANVGTHRGPEALNILMAWRSCLFAFITPPTNNTGSLQVPTFYANAQQNSQNNGRYNTLPLPANTRPLSGNAPYRIKPIEEVLPVMDQMGFSRSHRRLLLLVDGQRSIPELIRLVGRTSEEVFQHLNDLERAGFIRK